jgi:rubrerythrin
MSRYKWVYHNSEKLFEVGILSDGTLHNPRGYPDERRHERRSRAAKKAGETRRRRREKQVYVIAKRMVEGHNTGPRHHCVICGRGLDDPQSIDRGIGSECWQDIMREITRLRAKAPRLPPKCESCGVNYADPPSKLCPGCQAYEEHQR